MKNIYKIILVIIITLNVGVADKKIDDNLKNLDSRLLCLNIKLKNKKIECLKERLEKEINENYKNGGVQISVFSEKNEEGAKKAKKDYNDKRTKKLAKTKAEYILKEFKGHPNPKITDGKYYVVFVFEKNVSSKDLKRKLIKEGFLKALSLDLKIAIDINNKIISNFEEKAKIVIDKAECYKQHKNKFEFIECSKKEAINGIQSFAFLKENKCNKKVQEINEDKKINRTVKCVKRETGYYSIVETVEYSKKNNVINETKQKINQEAFILKKPEVLIK